MLGPIHALLDRDPLVPENFLVGECYLFEIAKRPWLGLLYGGGLCE